VAQRRARPRRLRGPVEPAHLDLRDPRQLRAQARGARGTQRVLLLAGPAEPGEEPLGSDPFTPAEHPRWSRIWTSPNDAWDTLPEERVLGRECVDVVRDAIAGLPPGLREVMTLRDVAGWTSAEVVDALGITEANQRVRLHRARARVRDAVEGYLGGPGAGA
jgi:RNA polymerase sigma-70 factor, ECF subfamily